MRISLNLATRPFADLGPAIKRLRIGMSALAVICIGLGIGLHFFHHRAELARARDHSLDGAIARIEHERQGYTALMQRPENAQLLAQSQMLNNLFDQKSFSWTLAMEDLETVLPGGVQVTQIEPKIDKEGKITLSMHVIGPRDREEELVENLEHSRRFLLPRIVGETATETEGASKQLEPVSASNRFNFDILADYNPAKPGERPAVKAPAAAKPAVSDAPARVQVRSTPAQMLPAPQGVPPGFRPGRPPYTGPQGQPIQRRFPKPNPTPVPNADPNAGGPQ
jgi:type IV pilus assembly protein PilN